VTTSTTVDFEVTFIEGVIADNDLADHVRAFRISGDSVWYIDRHVLGPDDGVAAPEVRAAACAAAVALAARWITARNGLVGADLLITKPYVIVDDPWLLGKSNAPPPHVIVCIARDRQSLEPADHNTAAVSQRTSGHPNA
jgi:hypothetical protein